MTTVRWTAVLVTALLAAAPAAGKPAPAPLADAGKAALDFLKLVDGGKFDAAYKVSGDLFQRQASRVQWLGWARAHRVPLGKLASRKALSVTTAKQLPDLPDGDYAVAGFDGTGPKGRVVHEVLAMARDKDGKWRVARYWIR